MPSQNNGYTRWSGVSTGIWQRRWVITRTGLDLCLKQKVLRAVIILVFAATLGFTSIILFVGQLSGPDSRLLAYLGDRLGEAFAQTANGLASWVLLYPEIIVDGMYRVIYYFLAQVSLLASFLAIALFIAKLITHDIASQAIVIYNSKALTRFDYLFGKFGIVALILSLIWIVPIVFLWVVGNLMSPDWAFFFHSFKALLRALFVSGSAVVSLSLLALALSALARRTSLAVSLWIMVWIFSGMLATAAQAVYPMGGYVSISYTLRSLAWAGFRLDEVWTNATTMLPFFSLIFPQTPTELPDQFSPGPSSVAQPLLFLGLFVLGSALILKMRIKSE